MLNFVYNPEAGKGKAQRFRATIEETLKSKGVAYSFWETNCQGDATRIVRELTLKGETQIVAMGGDGTLNEVLNGIADPAKVQLGLIPCGSGNDFAGAAQIPTTPEGALDVLLNCEPKYTDFLECSGVRGLNIIGSGIDVEILKRSYKMKWLKGSLNYFVSLLISLIRFRMYEFRARFNESDAEHKGLIVCACNGTRFGGGIKICPAAALDDGQMNVVIVENVNKGMIPGALLKSMQGKILGEKITLHKLAPDMHVDFKHAASIQIDGEIYDDLPFDVHVVHNQLKMYRK